MTVKKGRVIISGTYGNTNYQNIINCDVIVFEKTDGNYKEVISKIVSKVDTQKEVSSGSVINEVIYADEHYMVYPNTSLSEFYDGLFIPNYTLNYTESLTEI